MTGLSIAVVVILLLCVVYTSPRYGFARALKTVKKQPLGRRRRRFLHSEARRQGVVLQMQ
jgi:hypothetical protein